MRRAIHVLPLLILRGLRCQRLRRRGRARIRHAIRRHQRASRSSSPTRTISGWCRWPVAMRAASPATRVARPSAKFSPDGAMLAFTGGYDGGDDVYVMDARGGVPQRLTFHPSGGTLLDWTGDGTGVIFASNREAPGVCLRALHRQHRGRHAGEVAGRSRAPWPRWPPTAARSRTTALADTSAPGSATKAAWRRMSGSPDFASGDITKITDWGGSDQFPMWGDDGAIYFNSDREDGDAQHLPLRHRER